MYIARSSGQSNGDCTRQRVGVKKHVTHAWQKANLFCQFKVILKVSNKIIRHAQCTCVTIIAQVTYISRPVLAQT